MNIMDSWLAVFLGGGLGSMARYGIATLLKPYPHEAMASAAGGRFPIWTFIVNVVGSLAIGWLARRFGALPDSAPLRLFWMTGVLGGFTTYSAFALESVALLKDGPWTIAASYILGTLLCGIAAVWVAQN